MTKKSKHLGRQKSTELRRPDQPQGKEGQASKAPGLAPLPPVADFWHTRSTEELALEQGVQLPQDVDHLIGQGAECWDSDADFERWMKWLREIRQEGR